MSSTLRTSVCALLPVALLAVFTFWSGTFHGAASSPGSTVAVATLLGFALLGARKWRDPLGLGPLLPLLLLVTVLGSWLGSAVERAGREAAVLLPAWLLLPAGVATCWQRAEARRLAASGLCLLVAVVALWGLAGWLLSPGAELSRAGPALPLGHHNLLAAWLVGALPLALAASRRWGRGVFAVVPLALATVVLSRSLGGSLALLVQGSLLLGSGACRAWRRPLLLGIAIVAAARLPRLVQILTAQDHSSRLRLLYADAGWRGFLERPLLGWGPGSSRWLLAESLEPRPGLTPPGQVLTDLHSLPLQLLFELGSTGLFFAALAAMLFVTRRSRENGELGLADAPLLGLLGLAVCSLFGRLVAAPALLVLLGVLAGAALSRRPDERPSPAWPVVAYVAISALLLAAPQRAHRHYERAVSDPAARSDELAAAIRLDPDLPLYAGRLAWLSAGSGDPSAARQALGVAERARGLAPLFLVAGLLGQDAGEPWTEAALVRSCELDPLAAAAPFYLALETRDADRAASFGARALLADPRLAAAVHWDEKVGRYAAAVRRIATWSGLDPVFRAELLVELRALLHERRQRRPRGGGGDRIAWTVELDGESSTSLSLHAFRRPPWPTRLGYVELRVAALEQITLPAASELPETDPGVFPKSGCGAPE